ncbi:MAG: serine protease [Bacteriovoracaceae bacterium]|nr:serine protease [Bacteriovoracaceae bacterium]
MNRIILLLALCLTVVACSKGNSSSARKKVTLTPEMMNMLMAQQDLSCPTGDCPDSIARLFIINFEDAENSSMCSGSLVGERLLLTNSHCIEHGSLEQVCDGFYAVFKTQAGGYEIARCNQVLFRHNHIGRSRTDLSNQDYALIELDRTIHTTPLKINREGFKSGDTVHPFVVDHVTAAEGRIIKLNCEVSTDTSNGRDNVLEHCPAIPGNSGSAIISESGEIAGVLYAAQDTIVDERSDLTSRINEDTISLGFPMKSILEDLDQWL